MSPQSVARAITHVTGATLTGCSAYSLLCAADLTVGLGALVPANAFEPKLIEYLDGSIVLPPGTMWAPCWTGQGTSVLGGYSITWEEIVI